MTTPVIQVDGLSKSYCIGHVEKYPTFREALTRAVIAPIRRFRRLSGRNDSSSVETFWALQDISFDVQPCEVVGIIGRNGAGKSTLLKILSRITEPTAGTARIRGRVGSLLEVGTGFHPELSGRENIYLNGSILGMKKLEIDRKLDEIISFAEIEKFLDTPVKYYSSGMYVRLAFAVAAHLEPEILIIDEVLAVGDIAFQRKCLGKMGDVSKHGRTVLFVSHNISALQNLCHRGILLQEGRVTHDGPIDETVRRYLETMRSPDSATARFDEHTRREGSGEVRLTQLRVQGNASDPPGFLTAGEPGTIEFSYDNLAGARRGEVFFTIYNHLGVPVSHFDMGLSDDPAELAESGRVLCRVPDLPLPVGQYRIAAAIRVGGRTADLISNACFFEVHSCRFFPHGRTPDVEYCTCMMRHEWVHEPAETVGMVEKPCGFEPG